jgi:ABC-type nitrate/sulfonate/bicarbonate transport system substrate-binding protein
MPRATARLISACTAGFLLWTVPVAYAQDSEPRSVVRVSYIPGNFALPILVGIEHGLFAREGLFLSTVPVTDEGTIMRSLAAGGTDFAVGSQSLLLSLAENKIDAKVVAIAGYSRQIELIVPSWDTKTKAIADLKGKTVILLSGVQNFDAVPELYRALALSKPAMRLSDVKIEFVTLSNIHLIMDPRFKATYAKRNVGGIFMFSEYASTYTEEKKARVVLDNDAIKKLIGRIGAQPLFASNLVIQKQPKLAERFVRAWARTMRHISNPANKDSVVRVLQIYYLRQFGHLLKKELAERYLGFTKYDRFAWTDEDTVEVTVDAKALRAARNLLFARIADAKKRPFQTVPDLADFIDPAFAKRAAADLDAERKKAEEKQPAQKAQAAEKEKPKTAEPAAPKAAPPAPPKPGPASP